MSDNARTLSEILKTILERIAAIVLLPFDFIPDRILLYLGVTLINSWYVLCYSWLFLLFSLISANETYKTVVSIMASFIVFCIATSTIDYNHNRYTGYHSRSPLGPPLNTVEVNLIGLFATVMGMAFWLFVIVICA